MNKSFKIMSIICVLIFALSLTCCVSGKKEDWGSFSAEAKQYSYDDKYYSIQEVKEDMVNICVYSASDDELVYEIEPCRLSDYWGMVWESNREAFWIQSGDIGVFCYELNDDEWSLNTSRERPEEIVSRYDEMLG